MNISTRLILFFFCSLFLTACTPKLPEAIQKIQDTQFATGWSRIDSYPIPNGRSDDLHFFDSKTGFVVNSGGYVSYTEDGGDSWEIVFEVPETFFRCITFKNRQEGWLGTIGQDEPLLYSADSIALYETKDGGKNWQPVTFEKTLNYLCP